MSLVSGSLLFAAASVVFVIAIRARADASSTRLPPGPKGWPIIGNVFDIPHSKPWETYFQWSKCYGSVVHMNVFGQHIVVLNTAKAVSDLLETRSSIYSDRIRFIMISLLKIEWNMILMSYGSAWRQHRRAIHRYFSDDVIRTYHPVQLHTSRKLLHNLLQTPTNFLQHTHFALGAMILEVIYGKSIDHPDHPYLKYANTAAEAGIEAFLPGNLLVEFLPFLQYMPSWFPGAGFKRRLPQWYADSRGLHNFTFEDSKAEFACGTAKPSMVTSMLEEMSHLTPAERAVEEDIAKNVSATVYVAGADTTYFTMQTFYLAMVHHPHIQKRAQEELDRVVGQGRLPNFSDRASLPYICAIVKECLRFVVVVPLGVAHSTTEDDVYDGHFIPKGAIVMANQWSAWAILHNPEDYPEPETFRPERFLKNGNLNPDVRDPITVATGFGRRICPGRHFAESGLFMSIASILHTFEISPALNEEGQPFYPEFKLTAGLVIHLEDFECTIKPRSPAMEMLIRSSSDDAT
ncbi:hypothetical protein CERSUDRAFT_157058 [Gelatoporia subvermispora B]|uniref:Cytochrome P450 n=1 Tax=Ceriporiopsis subvermispora (strain B) TaxID=914234 RepID=M2QTH3_CERS8|nr:hypothetical protein CERSUDRAFT_157058 [Gelatoporia subvermispora B]